MALKIRTNIPSLKARNAMDGTQRSLNKAMAQLSTGSRINQASDDAAGLSISENLKSQIVSYNQAGRNANDGISMVQIAEGALNEVGNILNRFRELSIQAASDTVSDLERGFMEEELSQLKQEVERIAQTTQSGSNKLLNGEGTELSIQVGIDSDPQYNSIAFDSSNMDATLGTLGISGISVAYKEEALEALSDIDAAQKQVSTYRANLGALQNRLISVTENVNTSVENISAAYSTIHDADIAQSTSDLTKNNILLNATSAVLGQANSTPKLALNLLS